MYTKGETVDPAPQKRTLIKKMDQDYVFGHVEFITYEAEENYHNHGYYCLGKIVEYSQELQSSLTCADVF